MIHQATGNVAGQNLDQSQLFSRFIVEINHTIHDFDHGLN